MELYHFKNNDSCLIKSVDKQTNVWDILNIKKTPTRQSVTLVSWLIIEDRIQLWCTFFSDGQNDSYCVSTLNCTDSGDMQEKSKKVIASIDNEC